MKMTYKIAMAAAQDAGNRSMKKAGRKKWSKADYNVAAKTFNDLFPPSDIETAAARARMKAVK